MIHTIKHISLATRIKTLSGFVDIAAMARSYCAGTAQHKSTYSYNAKNTPNALVSTAARGRLKVRRISRVVELHDRILKPLRRINFRSAQHATRTATTLFSILLLASDFISSFVEIFEEEKR